MYARARYIAWARRFYGQVKYDLALGGMPAAPPELVGSPEAPEDWHGAERFRHSIAFYNDVPAEEAMPTLGTSHALWLAYASLLNPGDDVVVESPGYEPLEVAAVGLGARVLRFERPKSAGFAVDPAAVERAMTPRTRVVTVTSLHNPSGVRTSDDVLRAVADVCRKRGAMLLVDEVYAPFDRLTDAGVFGRTARKLAANVVVIGSLTKCYGLGRHRLGWLLGPKELVLRAEDALTATTGHLHVGHGNLGAQVLGRIDLLSAHGKALVSGRREQVEAWLATQDLDWSAPTEGLFGLATLRRDVDLLPAIEAGIASHGVVVAPGTFFGVPNGFRLSWASLGGAELDLGLARLAAVLATA